MSKLSLDALKERANEVQKDEMLDKIEGGGWSDCHGFWGYLGKHFKADENSVGFEW